MNDLAQNLIEELQCETVFTIPVLGGIPVSEAVVVTWIIMAVLVIVAFILTRNLKVDHISKRQAVAESIVKLFAIHDVSNSVCSCGSPIMDTDLQNASTVAK